MKQHFLKIFRGYNKNILLAVMFFIGSNFLYAQSNEALRIDSGGNVGIGTKTPAAKLDVKGDINFSTAVKLNGINILYNKSADLNGNEDVYGNIRVISNQSAKTWQDGMYINYNSTGGTAADLRLYANGINERMRILASTGNVGIGTTAPSAKLEVKGRIKDQTGYLVPVGGIIMYGGSDTCFDGTGKGKPDTPVEGWVLCDGRNKTPDLRSRFVVGAYYSNPGLPLPAKLPDTLTSYEINTKGGEEKHLLTIPEMPRHNHMIQVAGNTDHGGWFSRGFSNGPTLTETTQEGGTAKHENRPPYYALFFIMKL